MPNPRPIQNAVGDAVEFLNNAVRGTNLREQMAEAAMRERGLDMASKLDPWTTTPIGVDPIPVVPDYVVPTGRADPWLYSQPGIDRSESAFRSQMGSGASVDPQVLIGVGDARKVPPTTPGYSLEVDEANALSRFSNSDLNLSQTSAKPRPKLQRIPDEEIPNYRDEDWGGDPQVSWAELEALDPIDPLPAARVANVQSNFSPSLPDVNSTTPNSVPKPELNYAASQDYLSSLPDLGIPTTSTQGVQGILPGILIPEDAPPVQQFQEGLRRGFVKQMGDGGNYAQSIFSSPPRPQDETDLGLLGKAGVVLGGIGGDVAGHGSRKYLWNVHPEDVANTTGRSFLAEAGAPRIAQLAGAYGTALALGIGSGNYNPLNPAEGGRAAGYQANNPTEEDPRQSSSPIYDLVIERGLLGKRGKLLPWEQFHAERPDVSYEKYADYKDYLFNKDPGLLNQMTLGLVKGTPDGINGPELSVMGYGITPLGAAAALGTLGAVAAGAKRVASLR